MLQQTIELSLKYRFVVILAGVLVVATGIHAALQLPLDAFPDTTPVLVRVNTVAPALGPEEVEQQISFPIEQAIGGLPGLAEVRSISRMGFSQVSVFFEDHVNLFTARSLVQQQLETVDLPTGIERPRLGPISSALGEIYQYVVERPTPPGMTAQQNLTELRTIHDWVIKPQLRSLRGVAEINAQGGFEKQFHVHVDPARLAKYDLTFEQLVESLEKNNLNVGGGAIEQSGELRVVRGIGIVSNAAEIESIALTSFDGVPVQVRHVADVGTGHEIRRGAATFAGGGESVFGLGYMLIGENSRTVTQRIDQKLDEIRPGLPEGVTIRPVYRRKALVAEVLKTVRNNLLEGALLVVAVLFAFLGHLRAGLIVASAIPLSMLCASNLMLRTGVAGSLMSLGAIDFGLIVDSSVVMVENCVRRLAADKSERSKLDVIRDAAVEVRKPTMFGELIIMIVYLPILTLEGVEGKLFRPMALTVIFALAGSLVLSLTVIPALASLCLPRRIAEKPPLVNRWAHAVFQPVLQIALANARTTFSLAVVATVATTLLGLTLGAEFIPRLNEDALIVNTVRLPGVSLDESVGFHTRIERLLLDEFPDEIERAWTRIGSADIATDPMGLEQADVYLYLRPRDRWKRARTQDELSEQISDFVDRQPGMTALMTQPIEMLMNEMTAGVRADVGVKIYGDDLDALRQKAAEVATALAGVRGAENPTPDEIASLPVLEVRVDEEAVARYGVMRRDVLALIEAAGGVRIGEVREGQRRFPLVVRLSEAYRDDPSALESLVLTTAAGQRIPLSQLVSFERRTGPNMITREWGRRRIVVQCNVRGRDLAGFVAEARARIDPLVNYPSSKFQIDWGGQFEHLERAERRLYFVVPAALVLIFSLLYMSLDSLRDSLLVFTGVLFARIGGILGLWIRGMPFSISAGVGLVALAGAAILEGLILITTIRRLMADGFTKREAIEQARLIRLRPVLMTGLVAALGFVPMAFSSGVGSEVQRPLATVIVFGIATDTVLTMLVLPVMYLLFGKGPRADSQYEPSREF
jgi:cobalt-zinc-cadmium resistance protein CzcA